MKYECDPILLHTSLHPEHFWVTTLMSHILACLQLVIRDAEMHQLISVYTEYRTYTVKDLRPHQAMTVLKVTYLYITTDKYNTCIISGFRYQANKNCVLLGHYIANRGNFLLSFWDNLFIPTSKDCSLMMGPKVCPKISVINYPYLLCNNTEQCSSQV